MSGMLRRHRSFIDSISTLRAIFTCENQPRATGSDSDAFRIRRLGQARNERIKRWQSET